MASRTSYKQTKRAQAHAGFKGDCWDTCAAPVDIQKKSGCEGGRALQKGWPKKDGTVSNGICSRCNKVMAGAKAPAKRAAKPKTAAKPVAKTAKAKRPKAA